MDLMMWRSDKGEVRFGNVVQGPTDGSPVLSCSTNGTFGRLVCRTAEEWKQAGIAEGNKQAQVAENMTERKKKATAMCEDKYRGDLGKLDKARLDAQAAETRFFQAQGDVAKARLDLVNQIKDLDGLRKAQDTFHDIAGVTIDLAAIAGSLAFPPAALYFTGAGALGGIGNSVARSNATVDLDMPLDTGAGALDEAGQGLLEAVAKEGGSKALGHTLEGVGALYDLAEFWKPPPGYVYGTFSQIDEIKGMRDRFDKIDPRGWVEKVFGPKKEEILKKFDNLTDKLEQEKKALEELQQRNQDLFVAGQVSFRIGGCIETLQMNPNR